MLDTTEIIVFVALGALFAAGLAALSRWAQIGVARLAAYALIAVSFLYVGFAIRSENPGTWIGFEMTGVAVFGSLAGLSIIGAPRYVTAGFALHPLWAVYIHYFGAGSAFAPAPFVLANAGFDVTIALYVAYVAWRDRRAAKNAAAAGAEPKLAARSQHRSKGRV